MRALGLTYALTVLVKSQFPLQHSDSVFVVLFGAWTTEVRHNPHWDADNFSLPVPVRFVGATPTGCKISRQNSDPAADKKAIATLEQKLQHELNLVKVQAASTDFDPIPATAGSSGNSQIGTSRLKDF
jgi:hypothetical protein